MNRTHESKNLADALKEGERSLKFNISTRKFQELQEQLKKKKRRRRKPYPRKLNPTPGDPFHHSKPSNSSPFSSGRAGGPTNEISSSKAAPAQEVAEEEGRRNQGSSVQRRNEENEIEREGRVNNLHSDESIVLRQAHATVPIMALQSVDAPTTSLSLSFSLNPL